MKTNEMTFNGIIIALLVVMIVTPYFGLIETGIVQITTLHIPIIIGALVHKKSGLILGAAFGILSMLYAFTLGAAAPIAPLFQNPLISVVPRILFGLSILPIYNIMTGFIENKTVAIGLTAFLSTLAHTFFVLTAIFLFGGGAYTSEALLGLFKILISLNMSVEIILAVLVATPIIKRLSAFIN